MTRTLFRALLIAPLLTGATRAGGQIAVQHLIDAMPSGYHLQAYDDCGAPGRQPHVRQQTSHTYAPEAVAADERIRTVAWDWRAVDVSYTGLDPAVSYVVAVTYANEPFNARVQSLWAAGEALHGPRPLPRGGVERLLFRVPPGAIREGRLDLQCRLEGPVNVVVSVVELWAPRPSPALLRVCDVTALYSDIAGRVLDLPCKPVAGARVELVLPGGGARGSVATDAAGAFTFPRGLLGDIEATDLELRVNRGGAAARAHLPARDVFFEPVRYRPMPVLTDAGPVRPISLDGAWGLHTGDPARARQARPRAPGWRGVRVPGQWLQQGFELPRDQPVSMVRTFRIPRDWDGRKIVLRFDAVHAGARYWLNGHEVGSSQNLFTPLELDVTGAARPGRENRLDVEMLVDTPSERLAYASGYAFHNLGGIPRSVRLFALPPSHIASLTIRAGLDSRYVDGTLSADLTLEPGSIPAAELVVRAGLTGPNGRPAVLRPATAPETGGPSPSRRSLAWTVEAPDAWSAERPHRYLLTLDLLHRGRLLERIERHVGFRTVEVRGERLLVNGRAVKLAGACRHETDPLTGRADTARHAERDVRLLKEANLNYIRTAHYPPCAELLEAADRLGMYVEVEAPFCWVGATPDPRDLRDVLTPTSAMVDYHHIHPSVILWSLANESAFNRHFEVSQQLVRDLDPTRPTTFNNPDPKQLADVANLHYPSAPYDAHLAGDGRPLLLGEYWFPVCHEQTDVAVNPGLRELWGHGHAEPDSAWGRSRAADYDPRYLRPGAPPGAWARMVQSPRMVGGAIWAALDEPFYLPGSQRAGYAWVHGFWGILDGWRRPKPEWWLSKMIFSPVWFPRRSVTLGAGAREVRIPVENRYAFTDLSELRFEWAVGRSRARVPVACPPGAAADIALPVPVGVRPGTVGTLRVVDGRGTLVTLLPLALGEAPREPLPTPAAGPPTWTREGDTIVVRGLTYNLSIDRTTARVTGGTTGLKSLPEPHLTQYDFGDLAGPHARPYAVLPAAGDRVVEAVDCAADARGLAITVRDRYPSLRGWTRWVIDRKGVGTVSYEYAYTGQTMSAREVGIRLLLEPGHERLTWDRWSEWGYLPPDHIGRTRGVARARRAPGGPPVPESVTPRWPWRLDETELGTADFRSVKYCVYRAELVRPDGRGLGVRAQADAHVRACLDPAGVRVHVLRECHMGPVILAPGDVLRGEHAVRLIAGRGDAAAGP